MRRETFEIDHEVVDGETALGRGILIGLLVTVWAIAGVCAAYGFATGGLHHGAPVRAAIQER